MANGTPVVTSAAFITSAPLRRRLTWETRFCPCASPFVMRKTKRRVESKFAIVTFSAYAVHDPLDPRT
jgi:hypothetical protein